MKQIELIYFDGCPNAPEARDRVKRALRAAGVQARLREWERSDPDAPPYVQHYASPTILVDGWDVTGVGPVAAASACRAEGPPSVDVIQRALAAR